MKRAFLFFLASLALLGGCWAALSTARAEAKRPVLRWAAATDSNAPYAFFNAQNQMVGFEKEIIVALAEEMGRDPVFVPNDWDGLIPGLARGLYDAVICGIEITPDKAAEVFFTDPYYVTFEQLVNRRGAAKINNLDELRGKAIGTLGQTAAMAMLEKTPGVIVKVYGQEINAYQDVVNGRIDGVLLDYPIAKYYASPNPNLQFTGPPFGQISYGIALKKGNMALQQEMNAALQRLIEKGVLRDILSRWGLWTPVVAGAFGQPEAPSLPDTDFKAFVAAHAESPSLLNRLRTYANYGPLIAQGALMTLQVSLLGMALAIAWGFSLALLRVFGPWPLRWLATLYIEIVRGTPLLVQLLIIFYGLPNIGINLSPLVAGILGLGLNYAAYEAENYRAGLLAVPKGQMEAALALGLTRRQALRHVIMPQAFRMVLPPVTNDFISLLKDSSLVSMVTLLDLTGVYNRIATQTFDYFGTGLLIAAIYLLIGLPFVRLARWTEERLAVDKRRPGEKPGILPKMAKMPAWPIRPNGSLGSNRGNGSHGSK